MSVKKELNIIWAFLFLIFLLVLFPEYLNTVLESKIYTIFAGLGIFMIIFFIWLRNHGN